MTTRFAVWLALAGIALALAGCGGGSEETAAEPVIPAQVAEELARQSEAIAAAFEAGDVCGAAQQADVLVRAANTAIQNGQVPSALQGELQEVAAELQNTVNCPRPAPEEDEDEDEDKDKDKGKGKGKGKGNNGEEEVTTTTTTTTTVEGGG